MADAFRPAADETTCENVIEALLEAIPDLFFILDREGRVMRLNRVLPEKMNLPKEALLGQSIFDALPPEVAECRRSHAHRAFDSGEPLEYEDRHGSWYFRHRLRPIKDRAGKVVALAVFVHEVTRELTVERRLAEQEKKLDQAGKFENVGRLAGGVAHDFNNLLTGVLGNLYLARKGCPADSPLLSRLDAIERFALAGADLTRRLLGFARGGKYDVTVIDPTELVESAIVLVGRAMKRIGIVKEFAPAVGDVEADRSQLQQAVLNLLINAADAMPEGGTLTVRIAREEVPLERARELGIRAGTHVRIEIEDTGCGIAPDHLERVFEPFFTTKEEGRGTGLGLASALGIARNHGGALTAQSAPGEGSRFTLLLPATTRARPAAAVPSPSRALRGTGTILVVDDDPGLLELSRELLADLGYDTLLAGSGQEALERFRDHRHRIDLVLLDIVMPGTTAASLYHAMKNLRPDLPVLLVSGFSRHGEADDLLKAGCAGYLQKPYEISDLSRRIRAAIGAGRTA